MALGLPRVVPKEGLTIGGRFFPEGVTLSVNPWVFHRNPELFGEDCDTFNPDRWLQCETGKMDLFLIHVCTVSLSLIYSLTTFLEVGGWIQSMPGAKPRSLRNLKACGYTISGLRYSASES